jgi:peroxiredoxin
MAESTELEGSVPAAPVAGTPTAKQKPRARVFASVGLALAIIVAAWALAGQQGLGDLGKGGVNQKLLPKEGAVAPDFTVTDVIGNQITLSELRGKTVWINFWGSWCPPCRAEMPEIKAAYEALAPEGVVLLAISIGESVEDATSYAALNELPFPIIVDRYQDATGAGYPIRNYPTHLFIDPDGIVRHVVLTGVTEESVIAYAHAAANRA